MRATFIALFLLTACGGEKTADKPETTPTTQPSDPSPAARAAGTEAKEVKEVNEANEAKAEVKAEPKAEAKLPNGLTKAELAEKRKKINQRVEEMTSRVNKSAQPVGAR